MGYTMKGYRNQHLYEIATFESIKRSEARDNYIVAEFHEYPEKIQTFGKLDRTPIGKSKIIAIS